MIGVDSSEIGDVLIIMSGLFAISLSIFALVLWGLYKFFYYKPDHDTPTPIEDKDKEQDGPKDSS